MHTFCLDLQFHSQSNNIHKDKWSIQIQWKIIYNFFLHHILKNRAPVKTGIPLIKLSGNLKWSAIYLIEFLVQKHKQTQYLKILEDRPFTLLF